MNDLILQEDIDLTEHDFEESNFNLLHKTKEGVILYIRDMDDQHLKNTISLYIKKLSEAKEILEKEQSEFTQTFYKIKNTKKAAKNFINTFNISAYKYIAEAYIRDLDIRDLLNRLQVLTGRY